MLAVFRRMPRLLRGFLITLAIFVGVVALIWVATFYPLVLAIGAGIFMFIFVWQVVDSGMSK